MARNIAGNRAGLQRMVKNSTDGEMYETTQVLNELPDIGSKVIVREKKVYERAKLKERQEETKAVFVDSDSYFDAWGRPNQYFVREYTKGKDKPLEDGNWAVLETVNAHGVTRCERIPTAWIASGSMCLCVV